jgi:hypothetical protein
MARFRFTAAMVALLISVGCPNSSTPKEHQLDATNTASDCGSFDLATDPDTTVSGCNRPAYILNLIKTCLGTCARSSCETRCPDFDAVLKQIKSCPVSTLSECPSCGGESSAAQYIISLLNKCFITCTDSSCGLEEISDCQSWTINRELNNILRSYGQTCNLNCGYDTPLISYLPCDGVCINSLNDPGNCGDCGITCSGACSWAQCVD